MRWLLYLPLPIPLRSTFGEDAFEEFAGWFNVWMLLAPVFGQLPFDGGFEDGGFVAFEIGFDALEVGDGFVEAGELLFDLRDDAFLFIGAWDWDQAIPTRSGLTYDLTVAARCAVLTYSTKSRLIDVVINIVRSIPLHVGRTTSRLVDANHWSDQQLSALTAICPYCIRTVDLGEQYIAIMKTAL